MDGSFRGTSSAKLASTMVRFEWHRKHVALCCVALVAPAMVGCDRTVPIEVRQNGLPLDAVELLAFAPEDADCDSLNDLESYAQWLRANNPQALARTVHNEMAEGFEPFDLPDRDTFTFVAVGFDAQCRLVAFACELADRQNQPSAVLELSSFPPIECTADNGCSTNACRADGGATDSGRTDAALDGSTSDSSTDDGGTDAGAADSLPDGQLSDSDLGDAPSGDVPVTCGNGRMDPGEECDSTHYTLALEPCATSMQSYASMRTHCANCLVTHTTTTCPASDPSPLHFMSMQRERIPYTIPAGCYEIEIQAWGGGGGGFPVFMSASRGGAGGFATSIEPVEPGQIVHVAVGGAGQAGNVNGAPGLGGLWGGGNGGTQEQQIFVGGAGGGGRSDVTLDPEGQEPIVRAGGGGGAANGSGGGGCGGDGGSPSPGAGGAGGHDLMGGNGGISLEPRCENGEDGRRVVGGNGATCMRGTEIIVGGGGGGGHGGGGGGGGEGAGGGGGCFARSGSVASSTTMDAPRQDAEGYLEGFAHGGSSFQAGNGLVWIRCVNQAGAHVRNLGGTTG